MSETRRLRGTGRYCGEYANGFPTSQTMTHQGVQHPLQRVSHSCSRQFVVLSLFLSFRFNLPFRWGMQFPDYLAILVLS